MLVDLHDRQVLEDHRRARVAPLGLGVAEQARVERAEVGAPAERAAPRRTRRACPEAKSATTVFAVRHGRRVRLARLHVARRAGPPAYASRSQSTLAVPRSRHSSRHEIGGLSAARSIPPLSPSTSGAPRPGTAVVTKTRSPHTIGLECPTPGTCRLEAHVAPRLHVPVGRQVLAVGDASGAGPRNDGHSPASAAPAHAPSNTNAR